jgi:hypothetical protein
LTVRTAVLVLGFALTLRARADDPQSARATDAPVDAEAPARPELRPKLRVDGIESLARLSGDHEVQRRVDGLVSRRSIGRTALVGSVASLCVAGGLAVGAGFASDMSSLPFGGAKEPPNYRPAYVALGVSAGLALLSLIVWPRESDLRDVVTLWNRRHPGEPVELRADPQRDRIESAPGDGGPGAGAAPAVLPAGVPDERESDG